MYLARWREEKGALDQRSSQNGHPLFLYCLGEPCLTVLGCFSVLSTSAFLFRTEGVSLVVSLFLEGSSWLDYLLKDFFVIICPSTDLDIISRISKSANPASFTASMVSRKLAITNFWYQKLTVDVQAKTIERS